MGDKDIVEKNLEAFDDVFVDIVNGTLFAGRAVIKQDALVDAPIVSHYKADTGKLHEQERDVAKYWVEKNCSFRLAMIGIENQTAIDRDMPLRVIGYDGASYRSQLNQSKTSCERYPVITVILYFGKKPWTEPLSLYDVLKIPDEVKPFTQNYGINLIDVPRMSPKQIKRFSSDFELVADYFVHDGEFTLGDKEIKHVDATLKLMSVLTKDRRYEEYLTSDRDPEEAVSMCKLLDRIESRGKAAGLIEGKEIGIVEGKEANRKDMVLGMIHENVSMDIIARVAKLSVEQIKEIAKSAAVL